MCFYGQILKIPQQAVCPLSHSVVSVCSGQMVTDPTSCGGWKHTHTLTVSLSGVTPLLTSIATAINCLVTDRKTISSTGSGPEHSGRQQRLWRRRDSARVSQHSTFIQTLGSPVTALLLQHSGREDSYVKLMMSETVTHLR